MSTRHLRLAPAFASDDGSTSGRKRVISVVLGDDHPPMRQTLRTLLDGEPDVAVIDEGGDLASLERQIDTSRPDVLVLDLGMLDGPSNDAIRKLRERTPEMQIVIATMEGNPLFARRALDAGAIGFVSKDRSDEELPEAIRRAARGEQYVSPRLSLPLNDIHRVVTEDKLTVREVEVVRLIALGHTSVEIAQKLGLSPRTVETHRARIHRKLGVARRAELVAYALRRGLLRT